MSYRSAAVIRPAFTTRQRFRRSAASDDLYQAYHEKSGANHGIQVSWIPIPSFVHFITNLHDLSPIKDVLDMYCNAVPSMPL